MKPSPLGVYAALITDTFREALARWLFWGLFALSTLLIVIFLFVLKIDLVQSAVTFGVVQTRTRPLSSIEGFVTSSYAWVSIVLYTWGTFVAVFASSGLIPSVLEAGRISLLLSKPMSRTTLLMGRYVGNVLIVAMNHIYLIGAIWIIIGAKTHIWETRFLLAIPISMFMFSVLLCVVVFIGVITESAALSTMVPIALMLISAILAQRQIVVRLLSSEWSRQLWMAFYWIVPKVYDLGNAMKQIVQFDRDADWFNPVWTSCLFGLVVLSSAIQIFRKRDF